MASSQAERAGQNWPKFRPNEVVRVIRLDEDDVRRDRLGATGTVYLLEPDPERRRWCYWIEFDDVDKPETYYNDDGEEEFYWDDQLESLGLLQVDDDDGPLRDRWDNRWSRVPLSPWDALSEAEVSMTMHVEAPGENGEELAQRAREAVIELVPGVEVTASAERSEKEDHPDCWNLALALRSARPSREVFEQLVAADGRWDGRVDSGWWSEFWRHRDEPDPPEKWFGVSGVWSIYVYLWPLGDPTCYPIPANRSIPPTGAFGG